MLVLIKRTVVERTWRSRKGSPNTNNLEVTQSQARKGGEFVCKQVLLFEWGFRALFHSKVWSKMWTQSNGYLRRQHLQALWRCICRGWRMDSMPYLHSVMPWKLFLWIDFGPSYFIYSILFVTRSWIDFSCCILYVYTSFSVPFWTYWAEKNIIDWEQKQLIEKLIRFVTPHSLLRSKNFTKNCPKSFFV